MTTHSSGLKVRVTVGKRTADAQVSVASRNGRILFLRFDAALGIANSTHLGGMAVARGDDGMYRDLVLNEPVLIAEVTR